MEQVGGYEVVPNEKTQVGVMSMGEGEAGEMRPFQTKRTAERNLVG